MSEAAGETLVLGLGNPLMGDDGLGIAALARLEWEWRLPDGVRAVDGGTLGLALLPLLEEASSALILDAVDMGRPPGTLSVVQGAALPLALRQRMSCHEGGVPEILALCDLRGRLPFRLMVMGLQPRRVGLGQELSDEVARGLDGAPPRRPPA